MTKGTLGKPIASNVGPLRKPCKRKTNNVLPNEEDCY
jgi:hypothetical protein